MLRLSALVRLNTYQDSTYRLHGHLRKQNPLSSMRQRAGFAAYKIRFEGFLLMLHNGIAFFLFYIVYWDFMFTNKLCVDRLDSYKPHIEKIRLPAYHPPALDSCFSIVIVVLRRLFGYKNYLFSFNSLNN